MSNDRDEIVAELAEVRHDLNNLLMGLVGHVELMRGTSDLSKDAHRRLGIISDHLDRVREKVAALARIGSEPGS
jgi:signal transduction histidine kinase